MLCCAVLRAMGDAKVVQVVRKLRDKQACFRLLGLSATPGNEHSSVQVRGGQFMCERVYMWWGVYHLASPVLRACCCRHVSRSIASGSLVAW